MKRHILVISQYFYPENFRINDICEEWINRGYKVTVVTGIPNYPKGKFFKGYGWFKKRKESYKGIDIIRLPILSRGKSSIRLIMNYYSFVISGWFWKTFTKLKPDLVFIFEVSPMTQALPGVWFAKRRKIPCFLYVTDLWPESVVFATGLKNKIILNKIRKMVDRIYMMSTKILVSSSGFIDRIKDRGIDPSKIVYWPQYAEDIYRTVEVHESDRIIPKDNILNITFTGNIGYAQGLSVLVEAARELKKQNIIVRFIIIGDGRYLDKMNQLIYQYEVSEYFSMLGRKRPEEIPNLLGQSDIAFISLEDDEVFNITLPSKFQTYLACGKPLLVSANGIIQQLVRDNFCGLCGDSMDVTSLVSNIKMFNSMDHNQLKTMAKNSLMFSKKMFDKNTLMDNLDSILKGETRNV